MDDDADGEAEELVDLAHPLGVALGQVVVDGDDVDAVAGERVEVAGERGDEGFAFAGLHFGDLALVENHAADELHVEVAHVTARQPASRTTAKASGRISSSARFSAASMSSGSVRPSMRGGDAGAEFGGLGASCSSESCLSAGSWLLICGERGEHALDGAVIGGAEDFGELFLEQHGSCPYGAGAG